MSEILQVKRKVSYGEERSFRGLEAVAIKRRLTRAYSMLEILVDERHGEQTSILELGCGFLGRNLNLLKKDFPHVQFTGVDLTVTRQTTGIDLVQADITQWQPPDVYDGVLSLAVVEHLLDPRQHFGLIAKCLNKNGLACITTPTAPAHFVLAILAGLGIFDRKEIKDHQMYFTEVGLRTLAQEAGLKIEDYGQMSLGLNQWMLLRKQ